MVSDEGNGVGECRQLFQAFGPKEEKRESLVAERACGGGWGDLRGH